MGNCSAAEKSTGSVPGAGLKKCENEDEPYGYLGVDKDEPLDQRRSVQKRESVLEDALKEYRKTRRGSVEQEEARLKYVNTFEELLKEEFQARHRFVEAMETELRAKLKHSSWEMSSSRRQQKKDYKGHFETDEPIAKRLAVRAHTGLGSETRSGLLG